MVLRLEALTTKMIITRVRKIEKTHLYFCKQVSLVVQMSNVQMQPVEMNLVGRLPRKERTNINVTN